MRDELWKKKTKLTISGGIAKKSIKNIDKAKNLGKNSVIIENKLVNLPVEVDHLSQTHQRLRIILQAIKELSVNRITSPNHRLQQVILKDVN